MLTDDKWPDSLDEFVNYIARLWSRQVTDTKEARWCPEWWQHPEVMFRLDALWKAGTVLREGGPLWASEWMRDHVDPHMQQLIDPDGPLKHCGVRTGHTDLLSPLPVHARPRPAIAVVA